MNLLPFDHNIYTDIQLSLFAVDMLTGHENFCTPELRKALKLAQTDPNKCVELFADDMCKHLTMIPGVNFEKLLNPDGNNMLPDPADFTPTTIGNAVCLCISPNVPSDVREYAKKILKVIVHK